MKGKLIEFPEKILDTLAGYKRQTGISASDYIRNAVCRRMITDKIIRLEFVSIKVNRDNGNSVDMTDAIENNKFCDGASCEIPIQLPEIPQKSC